MKRADPIAHLRRYVGRKGNWREAVWNRWLISYLSPGEAEQGTHQDSGVDSVFPAAPGASPAAESARPIDEPAPREPAAVLNAEPEPRTEPTSSSTSIPPRADSSGTSELKLEGSHFPGSAEPNDAGSTPTADEPPLSPRPKFATLMERFEIIEDRLEALSDRFLLGEQRDRRDSARMAQLLERVAAAAERQSLAFESVVGSLERVERRVERMERRGHDGSRRSWFPHEPPQRPSDLPPENGVQRATRPARPIDSHVPPPALSDVTERIDDALEAAAHGPVVTGTLPDLSLTTLLSMFELERRTGSLTVDASAGKLRLELYNGNVVSCFLDGQQADVVTCLRGALGWTEGRFCFRQTAVTAPEHQPRSMGSLLLEATHQYDEAIR